MLLEKNWFIEEEIENILILSHEKEEKIIVLDTVNNKMIEKYFDMFEINNKDIINMLEFLKVNDSVIRKYKKSNLYRLIERFESE